MYESAVEFMAFMWTLDPDLSPREKISQIELKFEPHFATALRDLRIAEAKLGRSGDISMHEHIPSVSIEEASSPSFRDKAIKFLAERADLKKKFSTVLKQYESAYRNYPRNTPQNTATQDTTYELTQLVGSWLKNRINLENDASYLIHNISELAAKTAGFSINGGHIHNSGQPAVTAALFVRNHMPLDKFSRRLNSAMAQIRNDKARPASEGAEIIPIRS